MVGLSGFENHYPHELSGTTLMVHEVVEKAYKLKENDYKLLVVGTSPERYELSREARFMAHS